MAAVLISVRDGIENSIPTIDDGRVRVDEMEKCGHYQHWRKDFDLRARSSGIRFLRYGPPLHRTLLGAGQLRLGLRRRDLRRAAAARHRAHRRPLPLRRAGLDRQLPEPRLPGALRRLRRAPSPSASRGCSSTRRSTRCSSAPCSRPRTAGGTSSCTSDRAFVTALKHIVKANVLAMQAILEVRPDAIFIQSESSEYFHAENPAAIKPAEIMNARRFLSLDLNYGRRVDSGDVRVPDGQRHDAGRVPLLPGQPPASTTASWATTTTSPTSTASRPTAAPGAPGEIFGYDEITRQYYDRYRLPVMHTETNIAEGPNGDEAVNWLWKEWANVLRVRNDGVPIVGFTWYSLTDQVDWDMALRENNRVNPLGLYDLDRNIRPVGRPTSS